MRKNSSGSWRVVASIGMVSILVLGVGFVMALTGPRGEAASTLPTSTPDQQSTAQQPATPDPNKPLTIVALGDSLTAGVGDPSSKGYVGDVKDMLMKSGRQVNVQNFGISGLQSPELVRSITGPGIPATIKTADLVLISIGANDLTHAVDLQQILATDQIDEKKLITTEGTYTKNMETILKTVRASNPTAPVFVVGLYNPFEGEFEDKNGVINRDLNMWNTNAMKVEQGFQNVKLIPVADIFQWNTDHLLAGDHFHPNQQGYQLMAQRIGQALPANLQGKQ